MLSHADRADGKGVAFHVGAIAQVLPHKFVRKVEICHDFA